MSDQATGGHAAQHPRERRIHDLEAVVADVVAETKDAVTLVLETRDGPLDYRAGQFLTVDPHQFAPLRGYAAYLEERKGHREPPRAYSMASAPHERHLAFTVKEEQYVPGVTRYPPLLSPYLVYSVARGQRMTVHGFTGGYTLPDDVEARTDHLVHICAGSGIVPNFSILKDALARHPRLRQTLVYSNKTWDDVIYRDALAELCAANPGRLRVLHSLTRAPEGALPGPGVRRGRVAAALLREAIPEPHASLVCICGPAITHWDRVAAREKGVEPAPRFMEAVLAALAELGVPHDRVRHEAYG